MVKLRGLPFNVTRDDIVGFLAPVAVPSGGVHLMNHETGRPSGIAYVELATEDDQADALKKDKQMLGDRYIDTFACSQVELQARLAGGLERGLGGPLTPVMLAQQHAQLQAASCFVKLRGLPYSADQAAINAFFAPLRVVALQVALNSSGQPSGFLRPVLVERGHDGGARPVQGADGDAVRRGVRSTCGEMEAARAHAFVVVQQRQALQHGGMQGSGAYRGMAAGQEDRADTKAGTAGRWGRVDRAARGGRSMHTAYQAGCGSRRAFGMAPRHPPPAARALPPPSLPLRRPRCRPSRRTRSPARTAAAAATELQPYGGSGYDPPPPARLRGLGRGRRLRGYAAAGYRRATGELPGERPGGRARERLPAGRAGRFVPGVPPGYGGCGCSDAYAYSGAYGYGA